MRGYDYELLEFFGDAVISILVAFESFLVCPHADQGQLHMHRQNLTNNAYFAELNHEHRLGDYVISAAEDS